MTELDIVRLRAETPGTARVLHFNNAGAGLMPAPVLQAVTDHLQLEALTGGYEAADAARGQLNDTYDAIASLINCHRDEVAVVENATVAWNQAFYSVAETLKPGDRILTVEAEYASNFMQYLRLRETHGVEILVAPSTDSGETDVARLGAMLDDRVKLISVSHIPTNGGLINPAAEIGKLARAAEIPYLLDACQSVGQVPVDVAEIGCDFMSVTGRKYLRGPRGTGFLYASRRMMDRFVPPVLDLHSARWDAVDQYSFAEGALRYENWENYEAGKIGLGVAVRYLLDIGIGAASDRLIMLAENLRAQLATLPGIQVHDLGARRGGIVTFTHDRADMVAVAADLRARGINVSTTSAVSTQIDMTRRGLDRMVRASVHYYNTEQEVDRFVATIAELTGAELTG